MNRIQTHPSRKQLRVALGALAVAGCASTLVLTAVPALASTAAASKSVTGPEVVFGAVHGKAALANAPSVPITFLGVVNSHGTISLGNSSSKTHKLVTPAGTLTVLATGKQTSQTANSKTCRVTFTNYVTVKAVGSKSTGAFAGVSGPGAAQLYFAATATRFTSGTHKGQCNFSNNATLLAKGAVASFVASAVLTTP